MSDSESGGEGTSSSVPKKKKYEQKFNEKWEQLPEFKGWLQKSRKGKSFAHCKGCDKDINISSGKDALLKHSISTFHQKKIKVIASQSTLTTFATSALPNQKQLEIKIKEGEIRLSALVAEHNLLFTVMDHLGKIIGKICPDSKIAKGISCGRTKATAIVKNVIGQHSLQILCAHLKENKFSLIVDESTDLSTRKHLCLVVRSVNNHIVKDNFFGLVPLSAADSNTLYKEIITAFEKHSIPYQTNLIGLAAHGANVMMGQHQSVMRLLKNDIPNLQIIKCICHSFHLCASYASQKLPRFVEDLTRYICNYFGSSPKRTAEFVEFQHFCNVKIHKILHPCQTRWLSVHLVVSRILEQYRPLQLFFTHAVSQNDILCAENILKKLNDPTTKLFLQFLDFALPYFNNLNREMQSEATKIHIIYKNVCTVLRTLFDCFINRNYLLNTAIENVDFRNPRNYLPIEEIYFGSNVLKTLAESGLSSEQLHFFRVRCLDFYVEGCSQIVQRFPLSNNPLQKFEFIDPVIVKKGSVPSISHIAVVFPNLIGANDLQKLDNEWRLLRNTQEIQSYSNDVMLFWQTVAKIEMGDSSKMFETLTNFVFNLMCLPHSSANVERIFSIINSLKTKKRNKLDTDTIVGLLHSKRQIGDSNCYEFKVDQNLIQSMNAKNLYSTEADNLLPI